MTVLLVIDIGNSSTKLGILRANERGCGRVARRMTVKTAGVTSPGAERILRAVIRGRRPGGAVICSVVPAATAAWRPAVKRVCGMKPLEVSHRLDLGIGISYPKPASIGADRLANACAAAALFGTPVIAMDFGTALTFDVVSSSGRYVGGVIAPGPALMLDCLAGSTALLPRMAPRPVARAVGKSTAEAMRIGAGIGYLGMVREILRRLIAETCGRARLCATGGGAKPVLRGLGGKIVFDPNLTLRGLGIIWELNAGKE